MEAKHSFLTTVKRSAFDISYYQQLVTKTFFAGVKYLYLLLLICFFIGSVKSAITFIPKIPKMLPVISDIRNSIMNDYPTELVITIKNGELKTNVQEPYYIDSFLRKITNLSPEYHFITIDTKANLEDFVSYKTGILVTRTGIIHKDDSKAGYKVYLFEKNYNFTMDKAVYDKLVEKIGPILNYAPIIMIVIFCISFIIGPFIGAGFALTGKLIYVLIMALIFLIIAKVLKKDLTYKKIYVLSLFGLTLPVIVETIQSYLPRWPNGFYNNLPNLVFFAFMIIVMVKYQNQTSVQPQPAPPIPVSPPVPPVTPTSTIAQT